MSSAAVRKRGATPGRDRDREISSRSKRVAEDKETVEVVCRLSPYTGPNPCLSLVDDSIVRCTPPPNVLKRDGTPYPEKNFEFSLVFDDNDRQQSVFERCAVDLVEHLITGRNGLLFTYGVTGSGKTYTMTGKPTADGTGILPRTLDVVFNSIDNKVDKCIFYPTGRNGFGIRGKLESHIARKKMEIDKLQISNEVENRYMERLVVEGYNDEYVCSVFVSYVEIYNNYCYDLLEEKSTLTKRDTRLDLNNMVFVEGATEVEVESSDEALEVFCRGEERRRTSDTLLNKESSRSHSVFSIRLVMAPFKEGSYSVYPDEDVSRIVVSQLCLVDLAGSERAKRTQNIGDRLAEAGNINKSLMVLRQCIDKLRRNQRCSTQESIPYRDSKLTMLFKNYFEGSGKIRMIICANPKPDDFEENLNVLSFAEESQAVRVVRATDRLQSNDARPPVPRRFFTRWNYEIDQVVKGLDTLGSNPIVPSFNIKDYDDENTILKLRAHYTAQQETNLREQEGLDAILLELDPLLRSSLCVSDFSKIEIEDLRAQREKDAICIAEYSTEIKQLKRATQSLRERLARYEAEDKEMVNAEEELRRSRKEDRSRMKKQEKTLKAIQDICEGVPSPSFAQIRSKFAEGHESLAATPSMKRKLMTTVSTQISTGSSTESRRHEREASQSRTPGGAGYYNPKFHRRSKSAPRVLDHQPLHRVPTGGVLRAKLPPNAKQVTKPEVHHLQRSSDYMLTHQEVDQEGNISTSIVKGECIPTAGGGTAVLFNDVEKISHEVPGNASRSATRL